MNKYFVEFNFTNYGEVYWFPLFFREENINLAQVTANVKEGELKEVFDALDEAFKQFETIVKVQVKLSLVSVP